MHLFMSVVLPKLLHRSETWIPSASHLKRVAGFYYVMPACNIRRDEMGQKHNTALWPMADIDRVEVTAMRSRLHWLGHLDKLDDTHLPKCLLVSCNCPLGGKHSVSGQNIRWCDVIMRDLKKCNLISNCKRARLFGGCL